MGVRVFDQARRDLHDMTTTLLLHLRNGELRDVKEAREVDAYHSSVISRGVLSERLGDEYAGIVDDGIDAPVPIHTFGNCALGRLPVGDVTGDRQDVIIVGRPD